MSKPENCLVCGSPLTQPATGRPRRYCKRACHQVAEQERRRIVSRLGILETYASNLRLMGAPKRDIARIETEIKRLTARLVALLDGNPEGVASQSRSGSRPGGT
jgi:hypothetical protein